MKRLLISVTLILTTVFLTWGQSPEAGRRVEDLAKKKFQWMIDHRADSLEPMLDEQLKYIHSNGLTQTKKDFLDDLKSGKVTYQNIEVKEIDSRVYPSAAIVIGKGKFSGLNNGTAFAVDLLFTEVYILKDRSWRLASRHASKLP